MLGRYEAYQPNIASSAFIAPNSVIIGNVSIGENCVIWFGVIIRGGKNEIAIGERAVIEDNCVIHSTSPVRIGKNVIIGHNSVIHSCIIEDDVLIGPNVCVYDGAEIKTGAMIGINSVIQPKQVIEPKIYVQGNPIAKKVKKVKVDLERNHKYIEKNIAQAREFKTKFAML
jgi:carbonic anhydrase/acetyltransferase-like protein (isoleucine patch superfamily)